MLLAHVDAQYAGECAVTARVRRLLAEHGDVAVARDHGVRRPHDAHHVLFGDGVINRRTAARRCGIESRRDLHCCLSQSCYSDARWGRGLRHLTQPVQQLSGERLDNSSTCAFGKRNATKKLELGMRGSSIVEAGTAMLMVLLSASLIMALTGGCVPCSALNSNAKDDHKCCSRSEEHTS